MRRGKGFSIKDGTLVGYSGPDSDVTVPEGVKRIGEGAFRWEHHMRHVILPEGITEIGNFAFSECFCLEEVEIPEGVLSIGDRAFAGCVHLCNLEIPDSVKSIGAEAFLNCSKLIIHCKACSYAEKCAKRNGISVEIE